jgi:hypothetical protein
MVFQRIITLIYANKFEDSHLFLFYFQRKTTLNSILKDIYNYFMKKQTDYYFNKLLKKIKVYFCTSFQKEFSQ